MKRKDGRGSERISEDPAPYNNPEDILKGQPFVKQKDGRGSERISEDPPPCNKKMKIGKPRSKEDQTPTGKARWTTRTKKLCDFEREQRGTEETWFDPHDWTLKTQSKRTS